MQFIWRKPVLTFYRERFGHPEREPFAVVQAQRLLVSKTGVGDKFSYSLEDFFPLMGDVDCVSTEEGKADRYVLCWFDDRVEDFGEAFRRLVGVCFSEGAKFVTDEKGKRTYNACFVAKHGKLE